MEWFNDSLKIYLFAEWISVFEWIKESRTNTYNSPFLPPKKKMRTQELIGGLEIQILQQVSNSWP